MTPELIIGSIGAIMGPLAAIATLYIKAKYDSQLLELRLRLDQCEQRHDASDKQLGISTKPAEPAK